MYINFVPVIIRSVRGGKGVAGEKGETSPVPPALVKQGRLKLCVFCIENKGMIVMIILI